MTHFDLYGLDAIEVDHMNQPDDTGSCRYHATYGIIGKVISDRINLEREEYRHEIEVMQRETAELKQFVHEYPFAGIERDTQMNPHSNTLWNSITSHALSGLEGISWALEFNSYRLMMTPTLPTITAGAGCKLGSWIIQKIVSVSRLKFAQKISQTSARKFIPSLDRLSKAGQAPDRGGLSKAGRALDKHGGRPGSAFPKAKGTPAEKNAQGQFELDDILTDPKGTITLKNTNRFGNVIDVRVPNRGGIRFRENNDFVGFLEP
jgi:hypothetical protein